MIRIRIINPNLEKETETPEPTWYTRTKEYDWEMNFGMDEDIKNCTVGHKIDSIEIDGYYVSTKKGIDELIEFLTKSKESLEQ